MRILDSPSGVPYLPNEGDGPRQEIVLRRSLVASTMMFLAVFVLAEIAWGVLRGSVVERWLIAEIMARPTAILANLLVPGVGAVASGAFVTAPAGKIEIVSACTGTELYSLLVAALAAFQLPWRSRGRGLVLGATFVLILNQARILALYYVHVAHGPLFDLLHGVILPMIMIAALSLAFAWWLSHQEIAVARPG